MLLRCFCLCFFTFKISSIQKNIKQKLSWYPQYLYYSNESLILACLQTNLLRIIVAHDFFPSSLKLKVSYLS